MFRKIYNYIRLVFAPKEKKRTATTGKVGGITRVKTDSNAAVGKVGGITRSR